ncbi:MAG TPA: PQQ-binding-like beta-propeller repeat protein, partial [Phenylobacterium sp.]|nr:PQQ-binding-like beta-propeller repeat protein [Phenylobacterium sp.]
MGAAVAMVFAAVMWDARAATPDARAPSQVDHGKAVYEQLCAACHLSELEGGDHSPALAGPSFRAAWSAKPAGDLKAYVHNRMPPGRPDALSDQDVADVVAYILDVNQGGAVQGGLPQGASSAPATLPFPSPAFTNRAVANFVPVTEAMLERPPPGDWLNWRRTRDNRGFSPLAQVTARNVGRLHLAWGIAMEGGLNEPTPLVHDGVMYLAHSGGVVQALDAASGDVIWEYRYRPTGGRRMRNSATRSIAILGRRLFVGLPDAAIVALDARTGAQLWRTESADPTKGFIHSAGPMVAHGVVISGINGCDRFKDESCFVAGYDPETGRELWRTATLAQPGDPNAATWGASPPDLRAGGDTWISGAYDATLDTFYVGVGQPKPWMLASRGMTGMDAALYTNSTLALEPRSGAIKWWYQHTPAESLDHDLVYE